MVYSFHSLAYHLFKFGIGLEVELMVEFLSRSGTIYEGVDRFLLSNFEAKTNTSNEFCNVFTSLQIAEKVG